MRSRIMKNKNLKDTARLVAVTALIKMEKNDGYSNIVIDNALSQSQLNDKDKALATNIFYGTLEKRLVVDYYLSACLADPKKPLDEEVKAVLRAAVYQILFLEKIPDFAAVDEAVMIIRWLGKSSASGFVNGVLRSLLRKRNAIAQKIEQEKMRSLRFSIPEELISLWEKSYGLDACQSILEAFTQKNKQFIRINSLRTSIQSLKSELKFGTITEVKGIAFAVELEVPGNITALSQFQQGLFHVQDLSAQLVCAILDAKKGEVVYDLCAAPGGKSFTIAQQMGDKGQLFAFDLYKSRVKLIQAGAKRLGIECIKVELQDACQEPKQMEQADAVLCDVPCSGYGVIRGKPEIRYKLLSTTQQLPDIQYKILCNGAKIVKPAGRLFYTTCTLNPAENEEVAERFLQSHVDYEACPITEFAELRRRKEPSHTMTVMPYAASSDGFFIASFRKKR